MKISFNIKKLEAIIASSLDLQELNKYIKEPDLSHVKPMQRRRLSKSARNVFSLLKNFDLKDTPVVFSSKYGELNRCYDLLQTLSQDEDISPTSFSLSVHNAISSQYAIFSQNTNEISAISSQNSLEYAILDGYLKLNENKHQVLIISHFEGSQSEFLQENLSYTLALLIEKGREYTIKSKACQKADATKHSSLEFLKNYEKQNTNWLIYDKNICFEWTHGQG